MINPIVPGASRGTVSLSTVQSNICVSRNPPRHIDMSLPNNLKFDPGTFLTSTGFGRKVFRLNPKATFFMQGDEADSVFYLQSGRARLTIISDHGKEATITLLNAGNFFGEESLAASASGSRLATATAITACIALKIQRTEMIRVIHDEHSFSDLFVKFLLARFKRVQADLVDQLFNSSETRLARILLLMAEFGQAGEPEPLIPKITQKTLADMIGTTRSRVSFFMNKFRDRGFIEYNGRIRVNKSLLNVILNDQSLEQNAVSAPLVKTGQAKSDLALRRVSGVGVKIRHHDGLKD